MTNPMHPFPYFPGVYRTILICARIIMDDLTILYPTYPGLG
jgi:hypothetical protein